MNRSVIVRKIARRTAEKHCATPPVDVLKIIEKEGFILKERENQFGIEAITHLVSKPYLIEYNPQVYKPRFYFTLAHELGHIFIPWHNGETTCQTDDPYFKFSGRAYLDTQEWEANLFASELLLPSKWINEVISVNHFSFQELITYIGRKSGASTMACLYALEYALESCIFSVKAFTMEYPKYFQSKHVNQLNLSFYQNDRDELLSEICQSREEFETTGYKITYYDMLPALDASLIDDIYCECNCLFDEMINAITGYNPSLSVHFLNVLVENVNDRMYLVLKCGDRIRHIKSNNCQIRFKSPYSEYTSIRNEMSSCGHTFNEMIVSNNVRFYWIKEPKHHHKISNKTDSRVLIKKILNELFDEDEKKRLYKINGIIGSANGRLTDKDRDSLYTSLKNRFTYDPDLNLLYEHPNFDEFLANRVDEIISR